MSWTNYVFFSGKKGTRRHIDQNSYFIHIYIHTFIHSYIYVQNKMFFFALGKSPNYDIARDLNLIPEVGHLATASSSTLLQNYITQLKNWRDAKSWVGLWPGWGWSGIIITVRQQHTRKLSCVTRESKEERLNKTIVNINPWFFIRGGFWLRLPRFVENSKYFNLRFNLLPEVRTDHHHQYAKLLSLWYI